MKIKSSNVNFLSQHLFSKIKKSNREIKVNTPNYIPITALNKAEKKELDEVKITSLDDRIKKLLIQILFEKLTGKKIKGIGINIEKDIEKAKKLVENFNNNLSLVFGNTQSFSLEIKNTEYYREEEALLINSQGSIRLSDGKIINFDLNLSLYHFFEESKTSRIVLAPQTRKDPILINLDDDVQFKVSTTFNFDIDGDGKEEQIYQFENKGILFLDKNGDNIVSNGFELFGTKTGNGFLELSKYDEDGNSWIDEGDSIFNDLKVWIKLSDGKDIIKSLNDLNIAALYTQTITSPFEIKDHRNTRIAEIKQTSLLLRNNGTINTTHQVDYIV